MARSRSLTYGAVFLGVVALLGVVAPWLAPYRPSEQPDAVAARHLPPLTAMAAVELDDGVWLLAERAERTAAGLLVERRGQTEVLPLSRVRNLDGGGVRDRRFFLMGSDKYSRDVYSRWLYGARVSLLIAGLALVLALTVGVAVGATAALGGPLLDSLLMRAVDGLLAFPWLFLIITLTALFPTGTWSLILLLGMTGWMSIARLTRAELLSLKQRDFVHAARGLGASETHIFFRHLLPNAMTPLLVAGALHIGRLILVEASLSFLGFGVQPPEASWGNMIAEGRGTMLTAWWETTFPGLTLIATVVAFSLVSDGLRDVLDPRREPAAAR